MYLDLVFLIRCVTSKQVSVQILDFARIGFQVVDINIIIYIPDHTLSQGAHNKALVIRI